MTPTVKPKPKPKTAAQQAADALNGAGTTTATTPTTPPSAGNILASNGPGSGAVANPGGTLVLGQNAGQSLAGDNTDLLGPDTGGTRRTMGDALTALTKMSPKSISTVQAALVRAGILTGKYKIGVADQSTISAWDSAVKYSVVEQKSISQFINDQGLATTGKATDILGTSAAPAKPSYADPAQIAAELENQAGTQGVKINQANLTAFTNQIRSAEAAKPGNDTNVDVASEAQLFVQGLAAKQGVVKPGSQKLTQSTDADIDKAAATFGVELTGTARANIASQVEANQKATGAPDSNLINQLVAKQFRMPGDPSQLSGDAATVFNDLQTRAGQYLIPVSTKLLGSWLTKAIQNQSYAGSLTGDTEAEFDTWLKGQQAQQTPWLAAATNNFANETPWQATSGYRTQIGDVLGTDPDTVNLTDPKYTKLLTSPDGVNPPSYADLRQTVMTDPTYGYSSTPMALQQGYGVAVNLLKGLGVNIGGA